MTTNSGSSMCSFPSSESELRKLLSPEQYRITRENGTERPFSNEYWDNHREGIYVDVISGEALFSSTQKFDSETGWPSFTSPIEKDSITENRDYTHGMVRTEVRSSRSDAHLGHVFDDGPAPDGRRYCINSASLRFIPVERMAEEGYGEYLPLFGKAPAETAERATFAAGCFWGVEEKFRHVPGVLHTTVGYTGGHMENPTYKEVCSDTTGHVEAVEIEYDPSKVSYERLLELFWNIHDPTQRNRQGPDWGTQYRSVIFTHSPEQESAAKASKERLEYSGKHNKPVVTDILPASRFYRAEEYHQQYLEKNSAASCHP